MSADHRRRHIRWQRPSNDLVEEHRHPASRSARSYYSPPAPTQDRTGSPHQDVPLFTPPIHSQYDFVPDSGTAFPPLLPALPPLSFERSADTPQQPLPSLRSLSAGLLPPTPGYSPHPQSQSSSSHEANSASQASSSYYDSSRLASQRPAVNSSTNLPPFGYRYNRRLPATLEPGMAPTQRPSRLPGVWPEALLFDEDGSISRHESPSQFDEVDHTSKRRKTDLDKVNQPVYEAFQYGRQGQVEPGALKMEIASCDGGLYTAGSLHSQENILKADDSVYCTKSNRCNIVLQHQGSTAFTLKELIIKAPTRNYSSPVQQGVVFLSMSKDELVQKDEYHSKFRGFSNYPRLQGPSMPLFERINAFRQRAAAHLNGVGGQDATIGTEIQNQNDIPDELYRLAVDPSVVTNARGARPRQEAHIAQNDELPLTDQPDEVEAELNNAADAPRFYLVTEHSDNEEDGTDNGVARNGGSGWRRAQSRRRPMSLWEQRRRDIYDNYLSNENWPLSDSSHVDEDWDTHLYPGSRSSISPDSLLGDMEPLRRWPRSSNMPQSAHHPREFYVPTGSLGDPREPGPPSLFGGRSHDPDVHATLALPDAKFHMEQYHNKCTIRFNPPVTTRYILLKMWNPRSSPDGNIDIQGIVAKGFAGPRFYPKKELL